MKCHRRRAPSALLPPLSLIAALVALALLANPHAARAASDPDAPDRPSTSSAVATPAAADPHPAAIEDTSTKRASFEIAGYSDSDHVTVFTPSVAVGIDNVSGASLDATYLVDVVSAASVDIVSTASPRWHEVRQAGSARRDTSPTTSASRSAASVSSEPDYLSVRRVRDRDQGLRREELDALLRLRLQPRHDRALRRRRHVHAVQRLLAHICSAGRSTAAPTSSINRYVARIAHRATSSIENGDQSKPYRYIPMFSPPSRPTVPKGASIDWVNANRLPEKTPRAASALAPALRADGPLRAPLRRLRRSASRSALYETPGASSPRRPTRAGSSTSDERFALWPHVRFHVQTSVSFWQLAYVSAPRRAGTSPNTAPATASSALWTDRGRVRDQVVPRRRGGARAVGAAAHRRRDVHGVPR